MTAMSRALIVGASRGIGLELVRQYRADGWQVTATGRSAAALEQLGSLGAQAVELDVAEEHAAKKLADALKSPIDVAVYVAGVMSRGRAQSVPPREEFDRVMRANVYGAVQLIPVIAPMVEAAGGRFAFISSGLGSIAEADSSGTWLYRISKAALNMAVKAAHGDFPRAVFLALSPGWVRTDMGGRDAPVTVEQSVSGLRKVIASAQRGDSGSFLSYDGRRVAW